MDELLITALIITFATFVWLIIDLALFYSKATKQDKSSNKKSLKALLYRIATLTLATAFISGGMLWRAQASTTTFFANFIGVLLCLLIPTLASLALYDTLLRKRNVL